MIARLKFTFNAAQHFSLSDPTLSYKQLVQLQREFYQLHNYPQFSIQDRCRSLDCVCVWISLYNIPFHLSVH